MLTPHDEGATFDMECPDCAPALTADEVVAHIAHGLEAQVGQRPQVTCPSGLAAEVGAELTCALMQGDEVLDVAVARPRSTVRASDSTIGWVTFRGRPRPKLQVISHP